MAAANERINLKHLFALEYEGNAVVLEWCMANGLIGKYYECPVCSREMKLNKCSGVDGFEWRCHLRGENAHDRRRSIRNGTWFARSHLSIIVVLQMTYMWVYKASNEFIKNEMAVNNHTVIDWKGFCREVCMDICVNESVMLGGENEIVEIDESKFGSRKYNRGKRVDDGWVFAGVQRGTNKCFMQVVQQRDKETLLDVIKKYIRPGTTVISDCWKAYGCLQDESFLQLSVNRSLNFKDRSFSRSRKRRHLGKFRFSIF